jgi:hypothetical protein
LWRVDKELILDDTFGFPRRKNLGSLLLTGLLIGVVGGAFRLLLGNSDDLRNVPVALAHACGINGVVGFLIQP